MGSFKKVRFISSYFKINFLYEPFVNSFIVEVNPNLYRGFSNRQKNLHNLTVQ